MKNHNSYQPTEFITFQGVTFGRATEAYNELLANRFTGEKTLKKYEGMPLFDGVPEHLNIYIDLILQEMGLDGSLQVIRSGMNTSPQGRFNGGVYDLPISSIYRNDSKVDGETQWPVSMGLAHSWNKELLRRVGEVFGKEVCSLQSTNTISGSLSFAAYCPITDIRYNPLAGRFDEGFGEDPHIISELANIMADAVTGRKCSDDLYYRVINQTKHWASYNTEFFRGQNISSVSARSFYEVNAKTSILPFRTGAYLGYMSSYGSINGIPSTASFVHKFAQKQAPNGLMTICDAGSDSGYLEKTASSSGFSNGYDNTYSHDYEDKAASMLLAGHVPGGGGFGGGQVDMAAVLKNAISNGVLGVKEETLYRIVRPYIYAAVRCGAMDERDTQGFPKYYPFNDYAKGGSKQTDHTSIEHQKVALQASLENIVLTKNDGTLPLTNGRKAAVFGQLADTVQYGLYTAKILNPDEYNGQVAVAGISILEALKEKLGADNVVFKTGNEILVITYDGKYLTAKEDGTLYFADAKTEGSLFEMVDWGQDCISIYSPFCKKWLNSGAVNSLPHMGPPPAATKDDDKKKKRSTFVPGPDAPFGSDDEDDDDTPAMFVPGPDAMMRGSKGPNCNKDLTVYASGSAVFRPKKDGFLVDCQFPEFLERKEFDNGFALKCGSKFNTVDFGTRSATPSLMGWYLQEKDGKLMIDADPADSASKALSVEKTGFKGHYIFNKTVEAPYGGVAVHTVENTECAIVVIGMPYNGINGEGTDRRYLDMAFGQVDMAHRVAEIYANAGKRTVVVVNMNAPAAVQSLHDDPNISAILVMPTGGQYEAAALADILYGDAAPTGRLNATWYTGNDALPSITKYSLPYNAKVSLPGSHTGQIVSMDEVSAFVEPTAMDLQQWKLTYMYYEHADNVTYPFGYGLSYSTFLFSDLRVPSTVKAGEFFDVSLRVKNTGEIDTADVVQLYLCKKDPAYGVYAPKKVLSAFEKIFLRAGEEKVVTLVVKPDVIAIWDVNTGEYLVEGGEYILYASESSALTGTNTLSADITMDGHGVGLLDVTKKINLWKRSYGANQVCYREYSKARTAEAMQGDDDQWDETFSVMSKSANAWVVLKNVPLDGLKAACWSAGSEAELSAFELRIDRPDGILFGSAKFKKTGKVSYRRYAANPEFDAGMVSELGYVDVDMQLAPASGIHDLYVVFNNPDMRLAEVQFV